MNQSKNTNLFSKNVFMTLINRQIMRVKTLASVGVFSLLTISVFSQEKGKAFLTASGTVFAYTDADAVFGGTATGNVMVSKFFAMGIGGAATKFKGAKAGYNPLFGNFTLFLNRESGVRFIADLQAGYGVYNEKNFVGSSLSSVSTNTKGGLYISPGIGAYFKLSNALGLCARVAYLNSSFKSEVVTKIYRTTSTGADRTSTSSTSSSTSGLSISIGIKLG